MRRCERSLAAAIRRAAVANSDTGLRRNGHVGNHAGRIVSPATAASSLPPLTAPVPLAAPGMYASAWHLFRSAGLLMLVTLLGALLIGVSWLLFTTDSDL